MENSYWNNQHSLNDENAINSTYYNANQETCDNQNYDFAPITGDIFQPEEIFQLDQPLRPDYPSYHELHHNEMANSPPTFIDLGSGTIHKENLKSENNYWIQFQQAQDFVTNNDDSNISNSSQLNTSCSPESYLQNEIVDQNSEIVSCSRLQYETNGQLTIQDNKQNSLLQQPNIFYNYPDDNSSQDPKYFCGDSSQYANSNFSRNDYANEYSSKNYRYAYDDRLLNKLESTHNIPTENEIELPVMDYASSGQYLYDTINPNVPNITSLTENCESIIDVRENEQVNSDFRLRCNVVNNNNECYPNQFHPNHFSQFTAVSHN